MPTEKFVPTDAMSIALTSPVASPVTPAHVLSRAPASVSNPAHSQSIANPKPISDKRTVPDVQATSAPVTVPAVSYATSDTSEASTTAPDTTLSTATLSTAHTSPPAKDSPTPMRRLKSKGGSKRPPLADEEEVVEDDEEEATTAPSTSVHSAGYMKKLSAKHGKRIAARMPRRKRPVRRSTGGEKEKEKEAERVMASAAREREKQGQLYRRQRERERQEQEEEERAEAQAKERESVRREEARIRQEQELRKARDRAAQIKRDAQERDAAAARKVAETKRIGPRPDRPLSPSRMYVRKSRCDIGSPQSDDSKSTISPAREAVVLSRPVIGGLTGLLHAAPHAPHEQPSTHRILPPPRRSPDQVPQAQDARVPTAPALEARVRAMMEADVTPRPPTISTPTTRDLPSPNVLAEALKQQGQRQQPPRKAVQLEEANDSSTEDESEWEDEQDLEEVPPPPPPPPARGNQPRRPPLTSSKSTNNILDAAAQQLQRVQSDKDLFTKLPSRSYSNLAQQPRTGHLSQLLKPDLKIIEMRRTQTMVDVRGAAQPPPLLYRPPVMEKSKSAAALPMSSVSTSQAVIGLDTKAAAPAAPHHGG
ncbi:hypothetical protein EV715DRAFT_268474, partial [Schizophyllum commune]